MLEHQKPFESLRDRQGGDLSDETKLQVELSSAGYLLLQSTSETTLQDAVASAVGLKLPAPQAASVRGDYALLWLTPAEWLLELPPRETDSLQNTLTRHLARSLAVVTDMSDAFACCQLTGACAAETLMSGCSLDLRAHAFPAGRIVRTSLADIPTTLWKTGEPQGFRCLIDRSFAAHLQNWLADATRGERARSAQ